MLAKFIDSEKIVLQTAVKILVIDDKQIINPTDSDYLQCGFLQLEQAEIPQTDGCYYTPQYAVVDNKIVQSWTKHQYEQTADIETRLNAVEETADTTATAVEELIDIVLGGE